MSSTKASLKSIFPPGYRKASGQPDNSMSTRIASSCLIRNGGPIMPPLQADFTEKGSIGDGNFNSAAFVQSVGMAVVVSLSTHPAGSKSRV